MLNWRAWSSSLGRLKREIPLNDARFAIAIATWLQNTMEARMRVSSPTLDTPDLDGLPDSADRFRYGWRYVPYERPDGTFVFEQVSLTLEDVLHPQEGDFIVQSRSHHRICAYLYNVFHARVSASASAVVLSDVRVAWDVPGLKPHGPDIAVILGVHEQRNWSTFDVAAEGVRPVCIIEVTSPETRSLDLVDKRDEYDLAGVPLYIIVDVTQRRGQILVRLLGYQRVADAYEVLSPDKRGWLWIEPVRLWLGIRDNEVYCFDESGSQIGDYATVVAAWAAEVDARVSAEARALEAEVRADSEAQARIATETRLHELEAEVRRLRGEG